MNNATVINGARLIPIAMAILVGCAPVETTKDFESVLNFAHLNHLMERIEFRGDSVSIVHIYANYPSYAWVGAAESGPEGIACVDDAARAAVLALRHYEIFKDRESLARARGLLSFVSAMQTDDGDFYNFIFQDRSINVSGVTSKKSFGWWASRGIWAMGTGSRVLSAVDPPLARQLADAVRRSLPRIESLLGEYDHSIVKRGYRVPQWLPYGSGADVSSELMLGLVEFARATQDTSVPLLLRKLADGLMTMQDGNEATYPYGVHRSWETQWHMWGNGQTQALAFAGKFLEDRRLIESGEREARGFYSRLLIDGFFKEMDVADSTRTPFEQIAYGVRPMAAGLVQLYEATGKQEYLVMAGLAASWLLGNNVAGAPMYSSLTGRCYDGIRDSSTINKNSGAESTIEALMALLEVQRYDLSKRFLHARKVRAVSSPDALGALFAIPGGEEAVVAVELQSRSLRVLQGVEARNYMNATLAQPDPASDANGR